MVFSLSLKTSRLLHVYVKHIFAIEKCQNEVDLP